MKEPSEKEEEKSEREKPGDRSRWIAAISYVVFMCFFSLWKARDDQFIRFHARQGFLLLLVECVAVIVIVIFELAIGRVRFIGLVVIALLQIIVGLGALTLSVVGFVKALFGEYWNLPVLGEYRERVPNLESHRG